MRGEVLVGPERRRRWSEERGRGSSKNLFGQALRSPMSHAAMASAELYFTLGAVRHAAH